MKVAEGGVEGVMPEARRLLRKVRAWVSERSNLEEKGWGWWGGPTHLFFEVYYAVLANLIWKLLRGMVRLYVRH